jgi:hypothetical protein
VKECTVRTYATRSIRSLLAAALLCAGAATAAPAQRSVALAVDLNRAPADATADTWSDFVRTDELAVRIDTARVERRAGDGALLVWVRFEYAEPVAVPGHPDRTYSNLEIREALDCRGQRVADVEAQIRDERDQVLATTRSPAVNWKTFADHPFDADLFILACRFLSPRVS